MTQTTRELKPRRRPQFSLRTLLVVVTAVSVLLGVGFWVRWWLLLRFISWGVLHAPLAIAAWPVPFAVLWRRRVGKDSFGRWVLVLGFLFLCQWLAMVYAVDAILLGRPLSMHFYDSAMQLALNWEVPSVAVGLLVASLFVRTMRHDLPFVTGWIAATVGLLGFIWHGNHFFTVYMGETLSDIVWWL
jgi:ABC-type phosphate transport system permease subunit